MGERGGGGLQALKTGGLEGIQMNQICFEAKADVDIIRMLPICSKD